MAKNGAVLLGDYVACDAFCASRPLRVVTHAHADHLYGLRKSVKCCEKVLMTEATRDLAATLNGSLKLDDPSIEIARLPYALFSPVMEWELKGEVNNVVFPTGTSLFGGTLFIYYGAANRLVACASVNLEDLIAELLKYPKGLPN